MQSIPLKFGVTWILHQGVWEVGFYTLKFCSISKIQPSIGDSPMWLLSAMLVANMSKKKKKKKHYWLLPKRQCFGWRQTTISASNDLVSTKLNSQIITVDLKQISCHCRRAGTNKMERFCGWRGFLGFVGSICNNYW